MRIAALCCLACLFFAGNQVLNAQNDTVDINKSDTIIARGIALYDQGKYEASVGWFQLVHPCDPNYPRACYEMALSYYYNNEPEKSLSKLDEALALDYDRYYVYYLKSLILYDREETSSGISLLNGAMKKFPFNKKILTKLAAFYVRNRQPLEAEELLMQSLRVDPYYDQTHLELARANFMMGRLAESYLAFNAAILMNPRISTIGDYEDAISGKAWFSGRPGDFPYQDPLQAKRWNELRWLLQSEIAFQDKTVYQKLVNYTSTKQSSLLLHEVQFIPSDKSLYNSYYARIFSELIKKGYFETFMAYCYKNSSSETVKKWLDDNQSKLDDFINWVREFVDSKKVYAFSYEQEMAGTPTLFFEDNMLTGVGKSQGKNEKVRTGEWLLIDENGGLTQKGSFVNGKREGEWFLFWPDGQIKQHLFYKDDLLHGQCLTYYPNGQLNGIHPFDQGRYHGVETQYTSSGLPFFSHSYHQGVEQGEGDFYDYLNGFVQKYSCVDDSVDGLLSETWLNGKPKKEVVYHRGKYHGLYKSFFMNGQLESEGSYSNGVMTGKWLVYHPCGSLSQQKQFDDAGQVTGKFSFFNASGSLEAEETSYKSGLLTGTRTEYFENGECRSKFTYRNDTLTEVNSFDQSGNRLSHSSLNETRIVLKDFYSDGIIRLEGQYEDNLKNGLWRSYNPLGLLTGEYQYVKGMQSGPQKSYHPNGQLFEAYQCDSNRLEGFYQSYYSTGQLASKGWYKNGLQTGLWTHYDSEGNVNREYFCSGGNLVGRQFSYYPNGNVASEEYYNEEGKIKRIVFYNHLGKISSDHWFEFGTKQIEDFYPNGQLRIRYSIVDHLIHGTSESWYPDGQLQMKSEFIHGKRNGKTRTWDDNGVLSSEITYVLDKADSVACWFENGVLDFSNPYFYGEDHGKVIDFHPNGKVYREMEFVHGKRTGITKYYAADGTYMFEFRFVEGAIKGYRYQDAKGNLVSEIPVLKGQQEIKCFYPSGVKCAELNMVDGQYHGRFKYFYTNGKAIYECTYQKGDFEGVASWYYPNGRIWRSSTFKNGQLNGTSVTHFETGNVSLEGEYSGGAKHGEWKSYDWSGKIIKSCFYFYGLNYETRINH